MAGHGAGDVCTDLLVDAPDLDTLQSRLVDEYGERWAEVLGQDNIIRAVNQAIVAGNATLEGGDWQLSRFKADPSNNGKVLDTGLWRYTRHPNYFGNACIWWAFWLFAVAAGAWWTIFAPLLMTFLLLRVSGVAMLERTISDRRPAYAEYIRSTNAFFPGPRRRHQEAESS